MGSVSKRNRSEEAKLVEEIDRVSNLPDSIRCHIISFLPTKYAVATTILSTKWKYLFTPLLNLDFDDSLRLHPQQDTENRVACMSFMNFVDRVLNLCDAPHVIRFHLKCGNCNAVRVSAWISAAALQKVRELDLCISPYKYFARLPEQLFTCATLVVLKLSGSFVLNVPTTICLANLKKLLLHKIRFLNNKSIQRLFSSCLVLEDLAILRCCWVNITTFNICAPAVKNLTIKFLSEKGYSTRLCAYKIVIDAPKMLYLKYLDYVPEGILVKNLQALVEAHIHVESGIRNEKNGYLQCAYDFLKAISAVQFLHLSGGFMKAFVSSHWHIPRLSKLTRLELDSYSHVGWRVLSKFLLSTPLLETFHFVGGIWDLESEHASQWWHSGDPPSCMLLHLKEIKIRCYHGRIREFKMVKYFLRNARVLKSFTIDTYCFDEIRVSDVRKKILALPRASAACQMEIF